MNRQTASSEAGNGPRVLIVDGHPLFCAGMIQLLIGAPGIGPVTGATGIGEGTRLIGRFRPDVALVDPCLPGAVPFEIARQMQAEWGRARLLFLDGEFQEIHVRAALEAGAAGYWTKHASVDQILEAIHRAARGKPAFCRRAELYLESTPRGRLRFKSSGRSPLLDRLSAREFEVLVHLAHGRSVKECAQRMRLAPSTVDKHKTRLMRKLDARKVVELALVAYREGLVH